MLDLKEFFDNQRFSITSLQYLLESLVYTGSESIRSSTFLETSPDHIVDEINAQLPFKYLHPNERLCVSEIEYIYRLAAEIQHDINRIYRKWLRGGVVEPGQTFRLGFFDQFKLIIDVSYEGAH